MIWELGGDPKKACYTAWFTRVQIWNQPVFPQMSGSTNVVHIHIGAVLRDKEEKNYDACRNMDATWDHCLRRNATFIKIKITYNLSFADSRFYVDK